MLSPNGPFKVFPVVGDRRTGTEVIQSMSERKYRIVSTLLLHEAERFADQGEQKERQFVLFYGDELGPRERTMRGVFAEAQRRGYERPSLKDSFLFAEKYNQSELGMKPVLICHSPGVNLPRPTNPAKTRPHRLFLNVGPAGSGISLIRSSHERMMSSFDSSWAFAFCLPPVEKPTEE